MRLRQQLAFWAWPVRAPERAASLDRSTTRLAARARRENESVLFDEIVALRRRPRQVRVEIAASRESTPRQPHRRRLARTRSSCPPGHRTLARLSETDILEVIQQKTRINVDVNKRPESRKAPAPRAKARNTCASL